MKCNLILGDCLDVMPTLAPQSIDAIITDLPYGTTACSWDEVIPFAPMWEQVRRLLKPRGVFVTTASQPFTSKLVMSNPSWFRHDWVWNKLSATNPANSLIAPKKCHESVIVFGESGHKFNPVMWDGGRPNNKRGSSHRQFGVGREQNYQPDYSHKANGNERYPLSVIRLPFQADECNNTMRVHPTQKPVALYAYLIRTYANADDTVMDFCMGSGTTGVAAAKEGRNFVGVELDSSYFAIAEKRIREAQMQLPLLEFAD